MFTATIYIIACSLRNRLRVRLQRLREPRYLLGAIAGIAYFYFTVFNRFARTGNARVTREGRQVPPVGPQGVLQAGGPIMGLALLVLAALAWLLPATSTLLEFTEPEVQFLFPAPVSRRALLVYRIVRSQVALLFGALISGIFVPATTIAPRLRFAAGIWVLFVTIRVYFAGVTLARARLTSESGAARRVAWTPVVVILGAAGVVGTALTRAFLTQPMGNAREVFTGFSAALTTGMAGTILLPFTMLTRPLLTSGTEYVTALAASAAIMGAATLWLVRSDAAFQETAMASAERRAERKARGGAATPTARATGWTLAASGSAEGVFLWKNAMQMVRNTRGITLFRYVVPLVLTVVAMSAAMMSGNRARGGAAVFCLMAVGIAGFATLLGPQVVRTDLRDDLRHLEVLKTWPLRPAAVIRGEMLWNGLLITGVAWTAVICAAIFSAAAFPQLSMLWRSSLSLTALLLAPALVFGQLTVHNATAVLFPAWIPLGNARPRGLDMMGQRLLLLAGVLITLAVFMLPGAIVGGVLWFAFSRFIGAAVLVPGAAICLGIVAIEVLAITEVLGPAYERLDLTGIERPE